MTRAMSAVLFDRAPFEPPFPVPCVACGHPITAQNDWRLGRRPGTWAHRACPDRGRWEAQDEPRGPVFVAAPPMTAADIADARARRDAAIGVRR